MKLKNRRDDTSASETDEWPAMNDWFAKLRDDRPAGPARQGLAEPARDNGPRPETAAAPPARPPARPQRTPGSGPAPESVPAPG